MCKNNITFAYLNNSDRISNEIREHDVKLYSITNIPIKKWKGVPVTSNECGEIKNIGTAQNLSNVKRKYSIEVEMGAVVNHQLGADRLFKHGIDTTNDKDLRQ